MQQDCVSAQGTAIEAAEAFWARLGGRSDTEPELSCRARAALSHGCSSASPVNVQLTSEKEYGLNSPTVIRLIGSLVTSRVTKSRPASASALRKAKGSDAPASEMPICLSSCISGDRRFIRSARFSAESIQGSRRASDETKLKDEPSSKGDALERIA
jgi:hypothetical protein